MFSMKPKVNHMEFEHSLLDFKELERTEIDGVRHYITPVGTFKSVTTILGEKLDHSWLDIWKNRVGKVEVAKVSGIASRRGTAIHEICEKYLSNDPNYRNGAMPFNLDTFSKIKPMLDTNMGKIYGIESRLYSGLLKTAGTTDVIADYRGKLSIVDFKTSKRKKALEDIEGYMIQATAYAIMLEEMKGMAAKQIAILMAVDHDDPLEFIADPNDWKDRVLEVFKT